MFKVDLFNMRLVNDFSILSCHSIFDVFGLSRCHRWAIVYFILYTETQCRSSQKVSEEIARSTLTSFATELIFLWIRIFPKYPNIYIRFSRVNIVIRYTHWTAFGREMLLVSCFNVCLKWNDSLKSSVQQATRHIVIWSKYFAKPIEMCNSKQKNVKKRRWPEYRANNLSQLLSEKRNSWEMSWTLHQNTLTSLRYYSRCFYLFIF